MINKYLRHYNHINISSIVQQFNGDIYFETFSTLLLVTDSDIDHFSVKSKRKKSLLFSVDFAKNFCQINHFLYKNDLCHQFLRSRLVVYRDFLCIEMLINAILQNPFQNFLRQFINQNQIDVRTSK